VPGAAPEAAPGAVRGAEPTEFLDRVPPDVLVVLD
jgi:hypothetical protein